MKKSASMASGGEQAKTRSRVCKARRPPRRAVVKMLSAMEPTVDPVQEFLTSGRTGRRNALPNILGSHAATTTADLSHCLQKLSTGEPVPSTSGANLSKQPKAQTMNSGGGSTAPGEHTGNMSGTTTVPPSEQATAMDS